MAYKMNERGRKVLDKWDKIYKKEAEMLKREYKEDEADGIHHRQKLDEFVKDYACERTSENVFSLEDEVGYYVWYYGDKLPNLIEDDSVFMWDDKKQKNEAIKMAMGFYKKE